MKHFSRLLVLLLLIAVVAIPLTAQEGEGGAIVTDNIGDDPATFNPLIGGDTASSDIYGWLYPAIIGIDLDTGQPAPNLPQALATGWEYDETGTIVTITLREDAFWNDGVQITSADYLWAINAVRSGETSSPRTSAFATLADGTLAGGPIVDVQAVDDFTVQVTFESADCVALASVNDVTVVPAHEFDPLYGDNYAAMDEDPRRVPTATFGPFKDVEFEAGARVSLIADQAYPDTVNGYVSPSEWVYLSVGGSDAGVERFRAGDITYTGIPSDYQEEFRGNADFYTHEYPQNGFTFLGFNLANPENPQSGYDENGEVIIQDPHPIFADLRVRQALAMSLDVDGIIEGLVGGNATKIGTHTIASSWTFNPDLQYTYDVEAAKALLEEAGWSDQDGDGIRECNGCMYAEEGTPMTFRLAANAGNNIRERIVEFAGAEWAAIGADPQVEILDWGSAYLPMIYAQAHDIMTLGWSLGLPDDGDLTSIYGTAVDVPDSGFNFGSWYNAEFNEVQKAARDPLQTDGCDPEARKALIARTQQILHEDLPYIYLYNANVMFAAQTYVEGIEPKAFSRLWNIDAWTAIEP